MSGGYLRQLEELVDAVEVVSPTSYAVYGEERDVTAVGSGDGDPTEPPVLRFLEGELYARFYCRARSKPRDSDIATRLDYLGALSGANRGTGTWEAGWQIVSFEDAGRLRIAKDGLVCVADGRDVRAMSGAAEPGAAVAVRVGKESRWLSPGFFFVRGDAPEETLLDEPLLRLYWNLRSGGGVVFVEAVTTALNEDRIPFRAKVVADPAGYVRADAGVLYVRAQVLEENVRHLERIRKSVWPLMNDATPLFTKRLARGVGLAVDPGTGESFGQSRCALLARGLWAGHLQGSNDGPRRLASVLETFAAAGVDIEHPYLPSSGEALLHRSRNWKLRASLTSLATPLPPEGAAELDPAKERSTFDAAAAIAGSICARARWDDDRRMCNWVGRFDDPEPDAATPTYVAALGPDLYGGSTGIALFLADATAYTSEPETADVAVGALRRSVHYFRAKPSGVSPFSYFGGQLGAACTALRLTEVVRADLSYEIDELFGAILSARVPDEVDVVAGHAGAIPALLWLGHVVGERGFEERAVELGCDLERRARRNGEWAWWPPEAESSRAHPLTGFSHGASGIATALFELYAHTSEPRWLHLARAAIAFEAAHYDADARNWVDTRYPYTVGASGATGVCNASWCHGAPGIGLARLVALGVDVERAAEYEVDARRALATSMQQLKAVRDTPWFDATLCHGVTGLAEIVVMLGDALGDLAAVDYAAGVTRQLVERYGASARWPSGVAGGGANPTLMMGDAGIGHHLLRLATGRSMPSVLLGRALVRARAAASLT